jgi:hypothetical protein
MAFYLVAKIKNISTKPNKKIASPEKRRLTL